MAKPRQINIGIVGAGFAGLRCADVLLRRGCNVTIFEARNRLGGRVAQSEHLGHKVDLGPNWIHGTKNNPMMQIAQETETQLNEWEEESAIIDTNGKPIDADEAEAYSRLFWDDGIIAEAFRHSRECHDSIDAQKSLFDFFAEKAENLFRDDPADVAHRKRTTFLLVASMWGTYVGSAVTRQTLKYFWLEEVIEGENLFVAGTYHKILDAVAKPAREKAKIKLNTIVTDIYAGDDRSGVGGEQQRQPKIQTVDGSIHAFDEVVVTTPLGWLKRNKRSFHPALPDRLSQAIDHISYGTLDKVYITFPWAFWDTPTPAKYRSPTYSVDPYDKTPNGTATTQPQPQSQGRGHYQGFTHWLAPKYAKETNPEQWDQLGMNLAALSPPFAHPTILFYIFGDCSQHIASIVSTSTSPSHRDEQLVDFFRPYYSALPNFDPANPACTPKSVLATAWANDEFAGYGSYSGFQVGLQRGDEDIEVMRHGMPERGMWLAGEHTAPFVALGTSTGAYWSGEIVADRIVKACRLD